jgi:riboflavin kinase/FMN adenylyltransferase
MKTYSNYTDIKSNSDVQASGSIVAIGNFDGCHKGHKALLGHILEKSKELDALPLAFTFSPHPRVFFGVLDKADLLFSADSKNCSFKTLGIKIHLAQEFNDSFRSQSPEDFIEEVLIKSLNAKYVVIGDNFKFGKNRAGTSKWLSEQLESKGIGCKVFSDIIHEDSNTISSSAIRELLRSGDIEKANHLLGHPYPLIGITQKDNQKGRGLGFATANLKDLDQLTPKNGVYACKVAVADSSDSHPCFNENQYPFYNAVVNCGTRPTVTDDSDITVEAHFLEDGDGSLLDNLYGKTLCVRFLKRIRDEIKFSGKEELTAQIKLDIKTANDFLDLI